MFYEPDYSADIRAEDGRTSACCPLSSCFWERPTCNSLSTYFLDAEDTGRASILESHPISSRASVLTSWHRLRHGRGAFALFMQFWQPRRIQREDGAPPISVKWWLLT